MMKSEVVKTKSMKRNIKSLIGFAIGATDGDIGTVKDFYFEDDSWIVRYLVVETGNWLNGRKVLIPTAAHLTPDWKNKNFPIVLSKEQIKNCPPIDTELPVGRQQEIKLYDHYSLGDYWRGGFVAGGMPLPMGPAMQKLDDAISTRVTGDDVHLRSMEKVLGYTVSCTDGRIGTIEDFIIDDADWNIHCIVVDTGFLFSGKKVMLPPDVVEEIRWDVSEVMVDRSTAQVKDAPEYDKSELWVI